MAKPAYPLSKVYALMEPGPVLLLATAREGNPLPLGRTARHGGQCFFGLFMGRGAVAGPRVSMWRKVMRPLLRS